MPAHIPKNSEKFFFLLSGAIMSIPFSLLTNTFGSYFLLLSLPHLFAASLAVVVLAPLFEEFAKSYPLFYRHCETERSIFILGLLTGLGFGIVEFFLYIFAYEASVFARLPLVFFHAANTSIIARGIGTNKTFRFYLLAVLLHGFNNLGALLGGSWRIISIIAIAAAYILSFYYYQRSREFVYNSGLD